MIAAGPSVRRICSASILFVFSYIPGVSLAADSSTQTIAATGLASMLQVMLGLGLVLAAIAGTAWLLRKFSPGQVSASGSIRVVGGVAVGPKERVVLVDVGDTRLVLGVAPGQVSVLLEMSRPVSESATMVGESNSGKFTTRLKEILNAGNRGSSLDDSH